MPEKIPETYAEAAAYIEELPRFTKKHTLAHTREFLRRLGDPALDRKIVHVAGTNGKGSVCAYIQAILASEGKRTGFFTSPHLVTVNERIQLDRRPVDDGTFYRAFRRVLEAVRGMERDGLSHPSYFEFLFGMGMAVFGESDAEYIILETGLGGRLDATNAPERPCLTVITSISLDHTDILGGTVEKIAGEKAGIIKPGVPVFFDGSSREAAAVIRRKAEELHAPCREISNRAFEILEVDRNHIAFSRKNAYDKGVIWKVPICGIYQVMNAEIALEAAEYLLQGTRTDRGAWRKAIASVRWEGRMETAAPHLILDGAHNPGAIEAFADTVRLLEPEDAPAVRQPVVIFSAVSDKDYAQMAGILCERVRAKAYLVTEIDDSRAVPAKELAQLFRKHTDRPVYVREKIAEALETAYQIREEGEIYCVGSLYLAGMVKRTVS